MSNHLPTSSRVCGNSNSACSFAILCTQITMATSKIYMGYRDNECVCVLSLKQERTLYTMFMLWVSLFLKSLK